MNAGFEQTPADRSLRTLATRGEEQDGQTLSLPPMPEAPRAATATAALALRPRDFLITAALRPRLLLLAFLVPVAIGLAALILAPDRYPAETLLLVRAGRDSPAVADTAGNAPTLTQLDMTKVVRSELDLLRSIDVLREVVRTVGPATLYPWIGQSRLAGLLPPLPEERREARAIEALRAGLHAEVGENSNVLRVVYNNERPGVAISAMLTLLSSYRDRRDRLLATTNSGVLGEEARRAGEALRGLDDELRSALAALGVNDPAQETQLTVQRLDALRRREGGLAGGRATTGSQLRSARALVAVTPGTVLASRETSNQTANDESGNELLRLQIQRTHLIEQYARDHPIVREVDRKIATARAAVAEARRPRFATNREVRNPTVEWLNGRVATLSIEQEALDRQGHEITAQLARLEDRLGALRDADVRLRELGRQREVLETTYRQFTAREAASRIEEEAQGRRNPTIQVVQQPAVPYSPRNMGPSLAAFGVVAGLFLAGAALVLATLLRRSPATAEEARRGTGLPMLARLPLLPAGADPLAEPPAAVRDLVSMMLDSAVLGERLHVIQLVAPAGSEAAHGPLGLALAVAFARDRGQRTLMIDLTASGRAQLARLRVEPAAPTAPGEGLLAFNTVIPQLWIAYDATGADIADAGHGLHQTLATLERLRRVLDMVVIVAPEGDLESYGPRRLAGLVDANLLMLRAERSPLDAARALRDQLSGAGGRLPGFVLLGERRLLPHFLQRRLETAA
ncbi:MAG: hypothetical protein H7345_06310 [Rubritepida sp.]|nr:hypothetical protein [Rubritepida sp.]